MDERLYETKSVVLAADGKGWLRFGPTVMGATWVIKRMSTNGTGAEETIVKVYRGAESPSALVDQSDRALSDISDTNDLMLMDGEFLTVVYEEGTPGKTMHFRVEGDVSNRLKVGR